MTTDRDVDQQSGHRDGGEIGSAGKDSPRIVWLARLGALFVCLQAYVYIRWILSDNFESTPTGADPVPGPTMAWIRIWEAVCIIGGLIFIGWLIRRTRTDKRLPTLGVFVFAWLLAAWQDPGVNWIRPAFSYSSGFFNRGNWADFIPGWVVKGAETPQPIFYWLATYFLFLPLAVLGIDKLIATLRRGIPRINNAGIIAILFVLFVTLDIVVEQLFIRMGLWAYPRVNGDWSLFAGTMNQMPLYEAIVFGGVVSALSMVIYCFRDRTGNMLSDKGIERLRNPRTVSAVRVLALAAVFNVVMLGFNMGFNMINQHADAVPADVPSYFHNDICGLGPNPPCPPRP